MLGDLFLEGGLECGEDVVDYFGFWGCGGCAVRGGGGVTHDLQWII